MKNYKKIVAILMVLVTMAGVLSGCNASEKTSSDKESLAVNSSTDDSSETGEKGEYYLLEPLTIRMLMSENAYQPISNDSIAIKAIKEATNVSLEFQLVPGSDYETKKSTYLATDKIPDVFRGNSEDIKTYARDGMFLNLSDYEKNMPTFMGLINSEERKDDSKYLYLDDNLYSFVRLEKYRVGTAPQPMIRKDLLDKNNIPVPTTWDELYDTFLKLKELYPDKYMLASRMGTNYLIGQIAHLLGSGGFEGFGTDVGTYYEPKQDKYLFSPIQEEFKTVITFLNNMYTDKLLDPDYAVMTRDVCWEKLSSGEILFYYDNDTFAARTFNPALQEIDKDAYFDLLDPMKNSFGDTRALRYQRDWYQDQYIINSEVERPEDVVNFFDWMYTEEGATITNFGIENQSYIIENGETNILPELFKKHENSDDVLSSIQAEIGVGQFSFTPYIDELWFKQTADPIMVEHGERIDKLTEEGKINYMRNSLVTALTEEEVEKIVSLQTNVITVFNAEIDKFITGSRSMDEYDDFIKQLKDQGAEELEQIFNDAYNRIK